MAKQVVKTTKVKRTYRKSQTTKGKNGRRICKSCGRFM